MKIAVVSHQRCDEDTDKRTLVWIPDEMTPEQFQEAVNVAAADYLAVMDRWKKAEKPNDYQPYGPPPYENYPTLTVEQIKREWADKKAAWEEWDKKRQRAQKTFAAFLHGRYGIVAFYDHKPEHYSEVSWGHRHGVRLEYGESSYDQ
jgi:hypothetical protein